MRSLKSERADRVLHSADPLKSDVDATRRHIRQGNSSTTTCLYNLVSTLQRCGVHNRPKLRAGAIQTQALITPVNLVGGVLGLAVPVPKGRWP